VQLSPDPRALQRHRFRREEANRSKVILVVGKKDAELQQPSEETTIERAYFCSLDLLRVLYSLLHEDHDRL